MTYYFLKKRILKKFGLWTDKNIPKCHQIYAKSIYFCLRANLTEQNKTYDSWESLRIERKQQIKYFMIESIKLQSFSVGCWIK